MALFKRKNNPTIAEIESYYEQQNRRATSTGRAWLMAILAVIFTALIIAGLFFGGRWLYNTLTDEDTSSNAPEIAQQDVNVGTLDGEIFDNESSNESSSTDDTSEGRVDDGAATTNESNVDRVFGSDTNEETDSSTTPSSTTIPNTGPGETILLIAILSGILATTASYRKKLQN